MPVSDKSYMLADGATIDASGNGTGVLVGVGPLDGMKAFLHADSASGTTPTLDVKIQESNALASGYTDVPGGSFTQLGAIGSDPVYGEVHIHWTKKYLRYDATVGGTAPSYAGVVIGLTPGQIPTT